MIDGDMIEAAITQCNTTLSTKVQVTPERISKMMAAFLDEYGVTQEQIEVRIQRRIDAINAPLLISLTNIYNSLRDGMSKPKDWFEAVAEPETPEKPQKGNEAVKESLRKKKAKDGGADPETGEIVGTGKGATGEQPDAPVLTTEAEQPMPKLDTLENIQQAATVQLLALEAAPPVVRGGLFDKMHGMMVVDALHDHGQGMTIGKIKKLGISLPE